MRPLSAAPQALIILDRDPGVPLRSTPGFMLSSASRTFNCYTQLMSQVYYYRFITLWI